MDAGDFGALNATLNGISTVLLLSGYRFIRRRQTARHRRAMVAATVVSGLFFASYLMSRFLHGTTHFGGQGPERAIYLFVLGTHTVLAAAVPFLAVITLWRGIQGRYDAHRRIARWTLPIWLYVSVTGVLVYLLLRPYY